MSAIMGYAGPKNAAEAIVKGLEKLEYRGYDSAAIAVASSNALDIRRSGGKLENLQKSLSEKAMPGNTGIGCMRWAACGNPSEENSYPHMDSAKSIALVHSGIIENYAELKEKLRKKGQVFNSESDTEVIVHLIKQHYKKDLFKAVKAALEEVRGSYALGVICKDEPGKLVCARLDAPLIIGVGKGESEGEAFIASDVSAILPYTKKMIFLKDGDMAEITAGEIKITDSSGAAQNREVKTILWDAVQEKRDGYRHFMLKEIFEQPKSLEDALKGRVYPKEGKVCVEEAGLSGEFIKSVSNIHIAACGTSYHSALAGKLVFENFAKIPTAASIASEFRYADPILGEKSLAVFISQSGETADTLAALRLAKSKGCKTLAICNSAGSSISMEADHVVYTRCGPEIGAISTKTFTGQLAALYILALDWAAKKEALPKEVLKKYINELWAIPLKAGNFLKSAETVNEIAKVFARKKNFMYLGRQANYPVALEGALKLKETSYIHAEGHAAGEMKHGPIALINESMPVAAIAVWGKMYESMLANIEEVKAKGGTVIAVANETDTVIKHKSDYQIYVPRTDEFFSPFLTVIPLQLLAYYVSVIFGYDVDQPRNLIKAVTAE